MIVLPVTDEARFYIEIDRETGDAWVSPIIGWVVSETYEGGPCEVRPLVVIGSEAVEECGTLHSAVCSADDVDAVKGSLVIECRQKREKVGR